jgi:phosphoserine phosphatase
MAGFGALCRRDHARAMNGELDFEAALRERVALLKGLDAA